MAQGKTAAVTCAAAMRAGTRRLSGTGIASHEGAVPR